ncbi:hypothetical protein M8J76_010674 [Diaphorina citri]|nr:hypothetical protein M8J76_010674 [Diaphorina citri]
MAPIKYLRYCRLCANKKDVKVLLPLVDNGREVCDIQQKISALHIQFSAKDKLPQEICHLCLPRVEMTYSFISACQRAQQKLIQAAHNGVNFKDTIGRTDHNKNEDTLNPSHKSTISDASNDGAQTTPSPAQPSVNENFNNTKLRFQNENKCDNIPRWPKWIAIRNCDKNAKVDKNNTRKCNIVMKRTIVSIKNSDMVKNKKIFTQKNDIEKSDIPINSDMVEKNKEIAIQNNDLVIKKSDTHIETFDEDKDKEIVMPKSDIVLEKSDQENSDIGTIKNMEIVTQINDEDVLKYEVASAEIPEVKNVKVERNIKIHNEGVLNEETESHDLEEVKMEAADEDEIKMEPDDSDGDINFSDNDKVIDQNENSTNSSKIKIVQSKSGSLKIGKSHRCTACNKTYQTLSGFIFHRESVHSDSTYLCELCGKGFRHTTNLNVHMRTHVRPELRNFITCNHCDRKFPSKFALKEHLNTHYDLRPYSCYVCDKAFHKSQLLTQHMLTHQDPKDKTFQCSQCDKEFSRRTSLIVHIRKHSLVGKFGCRICGERFADQGDLKRHGTQVHTQDELRDRRKLLFDKNVVECPICHKFLSRATLPSHTRSYHASEQYPLHCLAGRGSLAYHMRSFHSMEGGSWRCQYCGDAFMTRDLCTRHEYKHTGHTPFKCPQCEKSFRCSNTLRQHRLVHEVSGQHKCQLCGDRPFECNFCEKRFVQKNDMLKHQKARHNEQVILNTNQAINDNNQVMDTNQVVNKNSQVIMDNNQVINDINQVTIDTNQVANDNNQVLHYNTTGELILPDNDASPFILNVSSMEIPAQNGSFQLTAQNRDPFELPIQNGSTIELQAQNVSQSELPNVGIDLPSGSMDFLQDSNELQYL